MLCGICIDPVWGWGGGGGGGGVGGGGGGWVGDEEC